MMADFSRSLAKVGFLEEQLLERHSPDLPVGEDGLTDGESALSGDVEGHDGDKLHIDIFTLHVNTTPVSHEPHRSGHVRGPAGGLSATGRDEPQDFELISFVMEFKAPLILAIENTIAMLHVGSDSRAKLLEHRQRRTLRLCGYPIEVVGDVVR